MSVLKSVWFSALLFGPASPLTSCQHVHVSRSFISSCEVTAPILLPLPILPIARIAPTPARSRDLGLTLIILILAAATMRSLIGFLLSSLLFEEEIAKSVVSVSLCMCETKHPVDVRAHLVAPNLSSNSLPCIQTTK